MELRNALADSLDKLRSAKKCAGKTLLPDFLMPAILRCSNPWRTMWLPRASSKHRLLDCAVVKRCALATGSVAERLVRGVVALMRIAP